MKNELAQLRQLYGSSLRRKLEIAQMKLNRVLNDSRADPADVNREAAKLQVEIRELKLTINQPRHAA